MRAWYLLPIVCLALPPAVTVAQYRDDDPLREIDPRYPGARPEGMAPPPRYLIMAPTASTLPKGSFDFTMWIFGNGGVLGGTSIGLTNQFQLGVSYGAESLLGESKPIWNPRVGFQLKLQLLQEQYNLPAVTVGYDDQGYGSWISDYDRYTIKSKGLFGVISKNFYTLRVATGFHGGINLSREDDDGDSSPDLFFGWDIHYNQNVSLLVEYTVGLNDNRPDSPVGKGRGYLNVGVRWEYSDQLVLEADITNLFQNKKAVDRVGRELRIVYMEEF
jgi:hypothetical protein